MGEAEHVQGRDRWEISGLLLNFAVNLKQL